MGRFWPLNIIKWFTIAYILDSTITYLLIFKNYKDKTIFQLKTFPMKLKKHETFKGRKGKGYTFGPPLMIIEILQQCVKMVSSEGYNASVEVISYKLSCL